MASNTVIRTNILALNSHRNLGLVGVQKERSSQRLSSGYRINSAADDAAGLAISEKMRAQIRGLDMANKNTQDGISLIQTAEGGMQEIDNMVQRIRELVVYAANDTAEQNSATDNQGDRQKIQDEINQLMQEIDSMASRVEFNKKRLIDGSYAAGNAGGSGKYDLKALSVAVDAMATGLSIAASFASAEATVISAIYSAATDVLTAAREAFTNIAAFMAMSAAGTGLSTTTIGVTVLTAFANASSWTAAQFDAAVKNAIATLENAKGALTVAAGIAAIDAAINAFKGSVTTAFKNAIDNVRSISAQHAAQLIAYSVADAAFVAFSALSGQAQLTNILNAAQRDYDNAGSAAGTGFATLDVFMRETNWLGSYVPNAAEKAVLDALKIRVADLGTGGSEGADTLWFQLGANAGQGMFLNINGVTTKDLFGDSGIQHLDAQAGTQKTVINVMDTTGNIEGVIGDDIDEEGSISGLLKKLDTALTYVTTERSKLGAAQNRLEYTGNSLQISSENLSAAESRIRNTDMGKEMMSLTQANILQQAAISMLAQGNMQPQSILQLLQ